MARGGSMIESLIIIILMLLFNAILAAYEMALASISKPRLMALGQQKRKGAEDALYMKDRIESSLAVIQIGITFAGAIAAATGGAGAVEVIAPVLSDQWGISKILAQFISLVFLIIPLSALTIIFSELVPKVFALRNQEWVCLTFSPMLKIFSHLGYPVVIVFEKVVKMLIGFGSEHWTPPVDDSDRHGLHELKAALALARTSRLIGAGQEKIVLAAAQLSTRPVSDIILLAQDISMLSMHSTLNEALIRAHLDMHTRFPVCEIDDDPQTVRGYVNFKDIVNALKINPSDPTVRGIVMPIRHFQSSAPISQVLEQMIQEKIHIALVKDGEGKIMGMITLEDILEELVGEIEDEYDRLPTYIHPYGSTWIMGGGVPMNTVAATLRVEMPHPSKDGRVPTLSEWFGRKINRPLHGGEAVVSDGIAVTVRKLRRKKLYEAIVAIPARSEQGEDYEN